MTPPSTGICALLSALTLAFALRLWRQRRLRGGLPLPPGPTGLPLLGNVLDINSAHPWLSYEQWGKRHGPLVYVNMLGMDFIIINSAKVAHDLLDCRSAIYSERPYMKANEQHVPRLAPFGMDFNSGLLPYGNEWRHHRKLYNTALNREAVRRYEPAAIIKARQLVENLLDDSKDHDKHFRTFATATIMSVLYGYDVAPKEDPFVTRIEHFIQLFATALTPEKAALLLAFPFLAHIPSWLPGGRFKQRAEECRGLAGQVLTGPVQYVKENMATGTARDSLVRGLLEAGYDEGPVRAVAATAFVGGAETTDFALRVFLLAMVLHPHVQVKARQEIDRVVGSGRLPVFADRPSLPYIEAIYLETHRWLPVVPDGLPHMTADCDVYQGMYIPKGAIVLTSIWAMGHDETRFDDPAAFRPERHLTPEGTLAQGTANNTFGFGRRVCPGRHLGDQNVWAAMVTMLATMHVGKAHDESGNEIEVEVEFTSGVATAPKPFACSITPSSLCAENLIRMRHDDCL